jgi:uncharacterized membrane protein YoaT (DUF817 family)
LLLVLRMEIVREAKVILIFHIVASLKETSQNLRRLLELS